MSTFHARLFVPTGIFHPESGGPATYLRDILPHLAARGWAVRVLTFSDDATDRGEPYPVTRIVRQAYPLRMARYALAARAPLGWAQVVYAHQIGLPLLGSRRAPRLVKVVGDIAWERSVRRGWVPPDTDIDTFQTMRASLAAEWDRQRRAREARTYQAIIVPSEYLKRMVVGWGVPPERVQVIYNALPPAPHAADLPATAAEARARLGLPADAPLLLSVGRQLAWKGLRPLIAALALARVPGLHLVVAGDGPELSAGRALAEQLGLASRVHLLGNVPRDQVPAYMRAADYVVLYSGYEGLSHTLLESLREGTPVIASDKGGNPEVVRHGINGLLVPYHVPAPARPEDAHPGMAGAEALAAAFAHAFAPGQRAAFAARTGDGMDRFTFAHMLEATHAALARWV